MHTEQITSRGRASAADSTKYETPAEKLDRVIADAVAESKGSVQAAIGFLLSEASTDVELLWELMSPYRYGAADQAIRAHIEKTERAGLGSYDPRKHIASAPSPRQNDRSGVCRTTADARKPCASTGAVTQQPCREGRANADAQSKDAPDTAAPSSCDVSGRSSVVDRLGVAATSPLSPNEKATPGDRIPPDARGLGVSPSPSRPKLVMPPQGRPPRGLAAVQEMNRGLMRTFMINGKPIADVTAAEARAWGASQQQRGRFAVLMAEGVPDHMRIGECKTEDDAKRAAELSRA